jgi:hypothetical protein
MSVDQNFPMKHIAHVQISDGQSGNCPLQTNDFDEAGTVYMIVKSSCTVATEQSHIEAH